MMEKHKLKELLDTLEEAPNSKWIIPEYTSKLHECIDILLKEVFTKDEYEWIEWWIWENQFGKHQLEASYLDEDNNRITVVDYDTFYTCLTLEHK